jgi:hypothetical protein
MSRELDEGVAAAALTIAKAAQEMRAHTTIRVAHALRQAKQDWPDVVLPLLSALCETGACSRDWSRSESADYLGLADDLMDLAGEHTGRTRVALHWAAEAVAELAVQERDMLVNS